jgi:hypothetical protein
MTNTKAILVGGLLGILSTLSGLSLAKADCSQDFEAAVDVAVERCDYWVQGLVEDGYSEEQLGGASGMWEACVRLETPVGPLPAPQHYDTEDGTFWKVAGPL